MTILGNLPVSPAILGKLLTETLLAHQQVKDQGITSKGVMK